MGEFLSRKDISGGSEKKSPLLQRGAFLCGRAAAAQPLKPFEHFK